jgi:lipopolysaccharide assembly outer membrane protein LptD (OstA)
VRSLLGVVAALTLLAPIAAAQQAPGGPPAAPTQPVEVRADSLEYESNRDVWVGRGHVVIDRQGRVLTADWVSFNPATRKGVAAGNVVIREGADQVIAEFVHFDVDTLQGILFDGELDAATSGFRLAGEEVRKTGEFTYTFRNGTFTTCRCPEEGRDPWTIEADEADLEIEGYGTARNTTFEVLGVPVLWLPWMIYPLMTERQTGFLFPEYGASTRSGSDVGLPFFWAARHNVNVTFTPRYLFKRGYKQDVAVEYVFGERSGGDFEGAVLPNDDEIDEDDPSTPFDSRRWGFQWRHDQWLSDDWRLKVDGVGVSDDLYTYDFNDLSSYRQDRFLQSVVFLDGELAKEGPLAGVGAVASLWWADDQQNHDDSDRDEFLLQRLPQLDLNLPERPLEIFGVEVASSFDVQYTNFFAQRDVDDVYPGVRLVDGLFADTGVDAIPDPDERNALGFRPTGPGTDNHRDDFDPLLNRDGTELNGVYDEGEPLVDRGSRLMLNPRLALPFELADGRVEIYPELGYLGAFYATEEDSSANRQAVTAQVLARTRLRRAFELPFGQGEAIHLFEPQLGWTLVSRGSQSDNPLFVPEAALRQSRVRQLDLFNVTRDFADRLPRTDAVTLAFQNRAYRSGADGYGRLVGDLVVSGQYSIADDRFEPIYLEGTAWPAPSWRTRLGFGYDIDQSDIAEGHVDVAWRSAEGHDVRLGYRYIRNIPVFFEDFRFDDERYDNFKAIDRVSQLTLDTRWAVTPRWGLTYTGRYSFEGDLSLSNTGGIEYLSRCKCWAVRFELGDSRSRGVDFGLQYTLLGLGKDEDPVRPFGRRGSFDTLEPL